MTDRILTLERAIDENSYEPGVRGAWYGFDLERGDEVELKRQLSCIKTELYLGGLTALLESSPLHELREVV